MAKLNSYEMGVEIRKLIRELAPEGTEFEWDNARTRFGRCRYQKNRITGKWHNFVISVSYPLAIRNDWEIVKATVLHEIAHANTPGHGHDAVWRRECRRLGCSEERCYKSTEIGGDVVTLPYKWVGTCPVCGKTFPRNRRVDGYCCDSNHKIIWKPNN